MSSSETNNPLPWTQEEDAELMRLRSLGLTWGQCAQKLGTRTPRSCASRASTLASASRQASRAASFWTPEDDALLAELWHVLSVPEISERLHRTVKGVYRRANRLGLTSGNEQEKRRWTLDEDAVLKANLDAMTYAEIGVLLGRTANSVKQRALSLQLRGGPKPRLPKLKRDGSMRKCHDCGKPTTDYRCSKCWVKLRSKHGYSTED